MKCRACPFCGKYLTMTWHIGHYDKPWIVQCYACGAEGPRAKTEEEAVELWNKRTDCVD